MLSYLAQFQAPGLSSQTVAWLASGEPAQRIVILHRGVAALQEALANAQAAERKFVEAGGAELRRWYGDWPDGASLVIRIARFDRAILAGGSLARYVTRLRARSAVAAGPIPAACDLHESGAVQATQLPDTYDYLLARTLAELVLRERPELDQFSGALHDTRRAEFAALDVQFIALTQTIIAQRANAAPRRRGVSWGPVKDLTEQSLIEHEVEKTRRHIPNGRSIADAT